MRFIADENIPLKVVDRLKDIDIIHITSIKSGLKDEEIVNLSNEERAVIITFDKDFGEIIFKHNKRPFGIIILRIQPRSIEYISKHIRYVLNQSINVEGNLVIVKEDRIKVIPII